MSATDLARDDDDNIVFLKRSYRGRGRIYMSVEAGETTDIACTPQIEIVLRDVKDTKAVEDKL